MARAIHRWWFHLLLFALTGASVWVTSVLRQTGTLSGTEAARTDAWVFTAATMAIVLAHELGHWFLARHHRVECSLPWFIPTPLLGFGTLGAVIRLRGQIPTRNALLDIGAAGPLAGLALALPLAVAGMWLSPVAPYEHAPQTFLGPMSLWGLAQKLVSAALSLPDAAPPSESALWFGDDLFTLVLQRLVKGPLPPGTEVVAHPLFLAAWFGLLVTMLNLLPVGQLDGGHVLYALFGARAERLGRLVARFLLVCAVVFSAPWLVWYFLVARVVRFQHPKVVAEDVPLTPGRRVVAALCLVFLVLLFMPVPLSLA